MDYRQIKAIEQKNKAKWLALNPNLTEESGIYFLTREEQGIKYAYVGQAKHILTRLAQHLSGYQHIDLSLKKHGLHDYENNECGWRVAFERVPEERLDEAERKWIRRFASQGFQLRNKTLGGQDKGKVGINDNKPSKGYRDGLQQGYLNARRYIAKLFAKSLTADINGKSNKNKEKALSKFMDFVTIENLSEVIDE